MARIPEKIIDRAALNQIVLDKFPTPLALIYQNILLTDNWHAKTDDAIFFFEVTVKALALDMVLRYLNPETRLHNDTNLDKTLGSRFGQPTLGDWINLFTQTLHAHQDHPEWFFFREMAGLLDDFKPSLPKDFEDMVTLRNEIHHGLSRPHTEEEWQEFYTRKIDPILERSLARFSFLEHYRILYVLEQQGDQIHCMVLSGIHATRETLPCPPGLENASEKFYLVDLRDNRYFELNPLFLPWPSDLFNIQADLYKSGPMHLAMYYKYKHKAELSVLFHVTTTKVDGLKLVDPATLSSFSELAEELDAMRQRFIQASEFNWELFKLLAEDVTETETLGIREKFSPELYFERQRLSQTFDHFLCSEKTAFVLLGASGVGKSNFLLALAHNPEQQNDVGFVLLNAAKIPAGQNLHQEITGLFTKRFRLVSPENKNIPFTDLLDSLSRIPGIAEKKVILAFDAVNENPQPAALMNSIDEIVAYHNYPWLKIVVTSRPEAWQNILRSQVTLTESRYYRQQDSAEIEFNLKGFDMAPASSDTWLKLNRFEEQELPKAYARYQKSYTLKTSFEQLSPEMKILLRDPLALRLVAESYRSEKLPPNVHSTDLYLKYIKKMIEQKRLDPDDLNVLLKKCILPLMFKPGHYRNALDEELLSKTIDPGSGQPLSEKIEVDDFLPSTHKHVNQAFQNLVDAEILIQHGERGDYTIGFKYERFYDYFGGEILAESAPAVAERPAWYQSLMQDVRETPFIWGPVAQALLRELISAEDQDRVNLVFRLIDNSDQNACDLLEGILTMYVEDDQKNGCVLLEKLFCQRKTTYRQMALRVAGLTNDPSLLQRGGADPDKGVRITAIQSAYHLWQRNPDPGWEILKDWGRKVKGPLHLPKMALAESALGLSLLIMTDSRNTSRPGLHDYQNPEIYAQLQPIWRQVIGDLLWVSPNERIGLSFKTAVRSQILTILIQFIFVVLRGSSRINRADSLAPIEVLEAIFANNQKTAQVLEKLHPYWGPSEEGLQSIESLLSDCFDPFDLIGLVVIQLIIQMRSQHDADRDLEAVERIYRRHFKPDNPEMAPAQLVFNSGHVLLRDDTRPSTEAWEAYTRIQQTHLDVGGAYKFMGTHHESSYLDIYTLLDWELNQRACPELFLETVHRSIEKICNPESKDQAPSLGSMVNSMVALAVVFEHPQLSLQAAQPIVKMLLDKRGTPETLTQVEDLLGVGLARIRLYHRDRVDNFLEDQNAPESLRHVVRTTVVKEDLWGDFLASRWGGYGLKIVHAAIVRDVIWELLSASTHYRSLEGWLNFCLRRIVNFIYGSNIFPLQKDSA